MIAHTSTPLFSINCRSVIEYSPKILKYSTPYRPSPSFLAIKKGQYLYKTKDKDITVKTGEVLFLPKGTAYSYTVLSKETETLQITFDIFPDETNYTFPAALTKLDSSAATQFFSSFPKLLKAYRSTNAHSDFLVSSIIFKYISLLVKQTEPGRYSSLIMPAISFLEQNFNSNFSVSHLSKLCNMSDSQLRRIFIKETGMSPLKYKNKLRVEDACAMLEAGELNITEIADVMRFDTPYAFSKFFKTKWVFRQTNMPQHTKTYKKNRNFFLITVLFSIRIVLKTSLFHTF